MRDQRYSGFQRCVNAGSGIFAACVLAFVVHAQNEPVVRIGLDQDARSVTLRSATAFAVDGNRTRIARFSSVVTLPPETRTYRKEDLRYAMTAEIDGGNVVVVPIGSKVRIEPPGSPLEVDGKTYRGLIEIFGNSRNTLTVVNELPLEEYLLGVVPNELGPKTFDQLEALKAQAVAARTYIVRNLGEYAREGYDICDTPACQVYEGLSTEDPKASQAVQETRGVAAFHNDRPIDALYSSTCGGQTENAENVFDEKFPYLVSTACLYEHPRGQAFRAGRVFRTLQEAVLAVAGVSSFSDARRFLGLSGSGEPPADPSALPDFVRRVFYSGVRPPSDLAFLIEQGILSAASELSSDDVLYRLVERKNAFEWQQGHLVSWDGQKMRVRTNGELKDFSLRDDAPVFHRTGTEAAGVESGEWFGGEPLEFRAADTEIQLLVFRQTASTSADRYSSVAIWQVRKTKRELDTAFRNLNIGNLTDLQFVGRGPSDRPLSVEISGTTRKTSVRGFRFRNLLGLRDSLVDFDIERNAKAEILGIVFFGKGWGHGVGLCQVGAYGMALDGATYEEILKKYYRGIELRKIY